MKRLSNMPDRPWTRDEVFLTINLYCKLPYRKLRQSTPEVRELALLLNRTPSAISKRCCNYVQFDPVESQRVKGFTRAAKLDKAIWEEINSDWNSFAIESEKIGQEIREKQITPLPRSEAVTFLEDMLFPAGFNQRTNRSGSHRAAVFSRGGINSI